MNKFFDFVILENTMRQYILVLLTIVFALLVKRFISKYLALVVFRIFAKEHKPYLRQSFLDLIIQPLQWFIFYFIAIVAFEQLSFPKVLIVSVYKTDIRNILHAFGNLLLIIFFIRLCLKVMQFVALILEQKAQSTQDNADNQLIIFFKDFFKVLLILLGILMIIKYVFSQPLSGLFTGLSIVGAALALATRESLENLIASFIIFFDKPFITGDVVKVNSFTGTIEKIGLRSTRIRTDQKSYITVPNKQMVDSILENISMRTQRKTEIRLEIDLKTPAAKLVALKQKITALMQQQQTDSFTVWLTDSGKAAHLIAVDYFTPITQTIEQDNLLKEQLILAILSMLEEAEIHLQQEKVLPN